MNKRARKLIFGLIITALIGIAFFFPYKNTPNILFLILLIGSVFGIINVLIAPIKNVPSYFMWEHYIPDAIKIIILFNTQFIVLGFIFSAIFVILIIKNIISMEQTVSHEII